MRAWKNSSSDDLRERYLGEIAPLLDAAKQVECLSPLQKQQVRKRIVRTLFRTRARRFRVRLVPVLAALGMLVIGGAAFATAERLGLIPKFGKFGKFGLTAPSPHSIQPKPELRKRKGGWSKPASISAGAGAAEAPAIEVAPASSEETSVVLPEVPDPLVLPVVQASTSGWALLPEAREDPVLATIEPVAVAKAAAPAKPKTRTIRRLAFVAGTSAAPVMAAPQEMPPGQFPAAPAKVEQSTPGAGSVAPPAFAVSYHPITRSSVPASTVAPASVSTSASAPDQATVRPATPQTASDQALFGQALRKLRVESDPAAALVAVREHARAYPRSSLSGERSAIEVEALLALHRDREALARLDAMSLDELPRSGERFVVRGELRAAARRWQEASADFDRALTRVSGSPAWHERALWGRGVARLRSGEREAGLADVERYRDSYPRGRFANEAARFFPEK
jgi:hypothetical protein